MLGSRHLDLVLKVKVKMKVPLSVAGPSRGKGTVQPELHKHIAHGKIMEKKKGKHGHRQDRVRLSCRTMYSKI